MIADEDADGVDDADAALNLNDDPGIQRYNS